MEIRNARTWCERCKAPVLGPDEKPVAELFLEALPEYRLNGGMGATTATEGFSRAGVLALLDLHAIPSDQRPLLWSDLLTLEETYRHIRHHQRQATEATPKAPKLIGRQR